MAQRWAFVVSSFPRCVVLFMNEICVAMAFRLPKPGYVPPSVQNFEQIQEQKKVKKKKITKKERKKPVLTDHNVHTNVAMRTPQVMHTLVFHSVCELLCLVLVALPWVWDIHHWSLWIVELWKAPSYGDLWFFGSHHEFIHDKLCRSHEFGMFL